MCVVRKLTLLSFRFAILAAMIRFFTFFPFFFFTFFFFFSFSFWTMVHCDSYTKRHLGFQKVLHCVSNRILMVGTRNQNNFVLITIFTRSKIICYLSSATKHTNRENKISQPLYITTKIIVSGLRSSSFNFFPFSLKKKVIL